MSEHNPERYSQLAVARPDNDVDDAIRAFFKDVEAARLKHRIPDVHVIARVVIERGDDEASALASAHFGAVQEAEGMTAWGYARSAESRREYLDAMKINATRMASAERERTP